MVAQTDNRKFTGIACLWLAAAVVAGVGLAAMASTWVFSNAPNDLRRTQVLLDALDNEAEKPRFVVMGNSVVMSGIDTQIIGALFPGNPLGYNLATTGQNPVDSFLYYQNLPGSVELIVQFTTPRFAVGRDAIEVQKYNAMYMYGYRPEPETVAELTRIFASRVTDIFAMSELQQRFLSRWAIKQAADNYIRQFARDDLSFESYTFDLYAPNNGARRLSDELMERALQRRYTGSKGFKYRPRKEKTDFYASANRVAVSKNIDYVLVISPIHPSVHEMYDEGWYEQVRRYFATASTAGEFPLIDATDAVSEEYYVDAVHLSEAGAAVLSRFIASELQRLNIELRN
jgi:hypothetical protein